jgi:hypothetical protein
MDAPSFRLWSGEERGNDREGNDDVTEGISSHFSVASWRS